MFCVNGKHTLAVRLTRCDSLRNPIGLRAKPSRRRCGTTTATRRLGREIPAIGSLDTIAFIVGVRLDEMSDPSRRVRWNAEDNRAPPSES